MVQACVPNTWSHLIDEVHCAFLPCKSQNGISFGHGSNRTIRIIDKARKFTKQHYSWFGRSTLVKAGHEYKYGCSGTRKWWQWCFPKRILQPCSVRRCNGDKTCEHFFFPVETYSKGNAITHFRQVPKETKKAIITGIYIPHTNMVVEPFILSSTVVLWTKAKFQNRNLNRST